MSTGNNSSEALAVERLCRTLNATVTNLFYAYTALQQPAKDSMLEGAVERAIA